MCYSPTVRALGTGLTGQLGPHPLSHNFFWNLRLLLPLGTYLEPPCSSQKLRWNFGFPNIEGNSKAGELINHAAKGL